MTVSRTEALEEENGTGLRMVTSPLDDRVILTSPSSSAARPVVWYNVATSLPSGGIC